MAKNAVIITTIINIGSMLTNVESFQSHFTSTRLTNPLHVSKISGGSGGRVGDASSLGSPSFNNETNTNQVRNWGRGGGEQGGQL